MFNKVVKLNSKKYCDLVNWIEPILKKLSKMGKDLENKKSVSMANSIVL